MNSTIFLNTDWNHYLKCVSIEIAMRDVTTCEKIFFQIQKRYFKLLFPSFQVNQVKNIS